MSLPAVFFKGRGSKRRAHPAGTERHLCAVVTDSCDADARAESGNAEAPPLQPIRHTPIS